MSFQTHLTHLNTLSLYQNRRGKKIAQGKRKIVRACKIRFYTTGLVLSVCVSFFSFPLLRLLLVRIGESTQGVASTRFARENWPLVKEAICNPRGLILRGERRFRNLPLSVTASVSPFRGSLSRGFRF